MRTLLLLAMANLLLSTSTFAAAATNNPPPHVTRYIASYYEIAIREMHRSGIPASVTLAQGIHESSWGLGELSTNSNNHFGIKCKSTWVGPTYFIKDDDFDENGKLLKSCFRVYNNVEESYIDHTNFLVEGDRYNNLFTYGKTNYKDWAKGLKNCGYATDPDYDIKLIRTIEKYNLAQYDTVAPPAIVDAPVFHIPGPELMPQTAAPQENVSTDLMVSSTVIKIIKPDNGTTTSTINTSENELVSVYKEQGTPPAAVNIEDYIRNSKVVLNEPASDQMEIPSNSTEEEQGVEEETLEDVVEVQTQTTEILSPPRYSVTPRPRTEKLKQEIPRRPKELAVTKTDDSHLQLMKGKMRVARKPRR